MTRLIRAFGTRLLETEIGLADSTVMWTRIPGKDCPEPFSEHVPKGIAGRSGLVEASADGPRRRYRVDAFWSLADVISAAPDSRTTIGSIHELGALLAQLHAAEASTPCAPRSTNRLRRYLRSLNSRGLEEEAPLARRISGIVAVIEGLCRSNKVVHGNPTLGNAVLRRDGTLALLVGEDVATARSEFDVGIGLGDLVEFTTAGALSPADFSACTVGLLESYGPGLDLDLVRESAAIRLLTHYADYQQFAATGHDHDYASTMITTALAILDGDPTAAPTPSTRAVSGLVRHLDESSSSSYTRSEHA